MAIKILDVGQCGFDGPRLEALWREALGAEVHNSKSAADALSKVKNHKYDIVLVNRVLAADGSSGFDVIRGLIASGTSAPVMLVSDLPEAQEEAIALGAARGFGKSQLGEQSTLDLVSKVIRDGHHTK